MKVKAFVVFPLAAAIVVVTSGQMQPDWNMNHMPDRFPNSHESMDSSNFDDLFKPGEPIDLEKLNERTDKFMEEITGRVHDANGRGGANRFDGNFGSNADFGSNGNINFNRNYGSTYDQGSGRVDVGESMKFLEQLISQMDPSKSAELRAQLKRITDDLANGNHQAALRGLWNLMRAALDGKPLRVDPNGRCGTRWMTQQIRSIRRCLRCSSGAWRLTEYNDCFNPRAATYDGNYRNYRNSASSLSMSFVALAVTGFFFLLQNF